MDFLSFPKIATTSTSGGGSGIWLAQEKLHGAQLVAGVLGGTVRFGKRKAWLADDESFFGWQLIRAELTRQARLIRDAVSIPATQPLYIYGELFGGSYPHPDVKAIPGMQPVQTGIWYAPDIRWSVFDAVSDDHFLDQTALLAAVKAAGSFSPPLIGRGRRSELLHVAERFTTRVPAALGLPELDGNLAEGLVVKPESRSHVNERVVVKRKIGEFDEKRFDESEAWDPNQFLSVENLLTLAMRMVNPARIASARSKVGDGNHEALIDEVVLDVLIDVMEAFPAAAAALGDAGEAKLREALTQVARAVTPDA